MFLFGPPDVEKMKARKDVKGLIKALRYQKDNVVRQTAADALGAIGDASAVEPLIAALKDKDADVRKAAAEALGKIGDARAVEPLIAALKDSNSDVRKAVAEALDELGWKPTQDQAAAWYWIAKREWAKCVEIGIPAMEPLNAILRDADDDLRNEIVEQIDEILEQITKSSGKTVCAGYYPLCFCGKKMGPIRYTPGMYSYMTLTCTSCGKRYSVTEDKDSITILIQVTPVGWSGPVKKWYSKSEMYVQIEFLS